MRGHSRSKERRASHAYDPRIHVLLGRKRRGWPGRARHVGLAGELRLQRGHGSVQLVIGPVGDRFGKYACIIAACAAASVLVLLCGLATSLPMLVVARLACGFAAGWIIPLAFAFLGDVIPYERRQQVLGTFLSGQILGQLFGQAAGGVLGDLFGWRRVFFFLAALFALATIALIIEFLRNPITHEDNKAKNDVARSEPEDQGNAAEELEWNGDVGKEGMQPAHRKRVGNSFDIEDLAIAAAHEDPAQENASNQEQKIGGVRCQSICI